MRKSSAPRALIRRRVRKPFRRRCTSSSHGSWTCDIQASSPTIPDMVQRDNNPYAIQISMDTRFVVEQSQPESDRYVFAYTVTLRNIGEVPARLLSRHWVITDANGKVEEVRDDGVVGEQPRDRKSTRLNSSHPSISYAVFCLKKKNKQLADTSCQ